ncbi:MAG: lysophospholipid acyltransferase family protein [Gemmatimonadales bacterium]
MSELRLHPGPPRRGTPASRAATRRLLSLFGWALEGELPDEPKFVLIVAPHTSNWDFFLCIFAMFGYGIRLSWLGKHTIFFWPAAPILSWLGGEPIDRRATLGTVDDAIGRFHSRAQWVMGLSPEGTRKRTTEWKSGFYRIAVGAGVPIQPVSLDYGRKRITIMPMFRPTGALDQDIAKLRATFSKEMARHPENFG